MSLEARGGGRRGRHSIILLKFHNGNRAGLKNLRSFRSQLNTEWAQVEVINLINDGSGLGFGIIGGRSTGVVVKTILPGGVADRVSKPKANILCGSPPVGSI